MRYLFFINPVAGKGGSQETLRSDIEEYFKKNGGEFKIYTTSYSGEAEEVARKEAMTGERIRMFACGGEGTCYEVLNGIVGYDNVELEFAPGALEAVADRAIEMKIGARGLRSVMEGVMTDIMYTVPSDPSIKKVTITAESVKEGTSPLIERHNDK